MAHLPFLLCVYKFMALGGLRPWPSNWGCATESHWGLCFQTPIYWLALYTCYALSRSTFHCTELMVFRFSSMRVRGIIWVPRMFPAQSYWCVDANDYSLGWCGGNNHLKWYISARVQLRSCILDKSCHFYSSFWHLRPTTVLNVIMFYFVPERFVCRVLWCFFFQTALWFMLL